MRRVRVKQLRRALSSALGRPLNDTIVDINGEVVKPNEFRQLKKDCLKLRQKYGKYGKPFAINVIRDTSGRPIRLIQNGFWKCLMCSMVAFGTDPSNHACDS